MILPTAHVTAQGGRIGTGKFKVIPRLTIREVHDDNIYRGNGTNNAGEREVSDWITHVIPAIGLHYRFRQRGGLSLGFEGNHAHYCENHANDWDAHKAVFNLGYQAPGGLILGINNIHTETEDPYGSPEQYGIGLKAERWTHAFMGKIGYDFGNRLKILFFCNSYEQEYYHFEGSPYNYFSGELGFGLETRVLPKTSAFVRYHFGHRDYFSHYATPADEFTDSDFRRFRVNAGLTWDTGAKVTGELNFGHQWIYYDNDIDAWWNEYPDRNTWIASTNVAFQAGPNTMLALTFERIPREARCDRSEYFVETGLEMSLEQVIRRKTTLTVGGACSHDRFYLPANNARKDDNYMANIRLDYRPRDWLTAALGYSYGRKDSNYAANDYTDNRFMISLSAVY
ncbi:MAG: outer membrane beta-barrel protein [Desulfobacterales bacterium]|nr:outer membrane beta-barrel protein [Desulfobacterales bacterium]